MTLNNAELYVVEAVQWLKLAVETTGAAIVAFGFVFALFQLSRSAFRRDPSSFTTIRLSLARYLALALEFQLGADILSTAISPSWDEIGKLGVIAIIRTGLNHFLMYEMRTEKTIVKPNEPVKHEVSPDSNSEKG